MPSMEQQLEVSLTGRQHHRIAVDQRDAPVRVETSVAVVRLTVRDHPWIRRSHEQLEQPIVLGQESADSRSPSFVMAPFSAQGAEARRPSPSLRR